MKFLSVKRKRAIDRRNRRLAERYDQGWRSVHSYSMRDFATAEIGRVESFRMVA